MKIAFFGTPETALPYLRRLAEEQEIVAVVTQPDRPAGRGRHLVASPVKQEAERLGLPILQPPRVRSAAFCACNEISAAELIVVVAYGQILPGDLCATEARPAINVHYSLLPQLRGSAPVQRALLQGLSETGITIQYIAEELDAGDVILQRSVPLTPEDDAGTLFERLQAAGVPALSEAVHLLAAGQAPRQPQDSARATYAPPLSPHEAAVDWCQPAEAIVNQIRAFSPRPGTYCHYRGVRVKLYASKRVPCSSEAAGPGTVVDLSSAGVLVHAGEDCVLVGEVQPAGKRRMAASDFARGARMAPGAMLAGGLTAGEQPD